MEGLEEALEDLKGKGGVFKGLKPTILGYAYYGATVYPTYELLKIFYSEGTADPTIVSLLSGASAAVIASIGLCPAENWRISVIKDLEVNFKQSYSGFGPLLTRQVVFGSVKFLAFEEFRVFILNYLGSSGAVDIMTGLGATVLAGLGSGVLSCFVSQPFDTILTAGAGSSNNVFNTVKEIVGKSGVLGLWRGVGGRAVWSGFIIGGQFFLYDVFKGVVGIGAVETAVETLEVVKEFEAVL
ncbi:hypothetical protein TL16_g08842 [Triparma laevis f. inornata]|uniref:Uncharacterized protein n=1 Tax=Triparma laevis f. inornata TaxID=1714386 RepID=A0A9W7B301_9STRA|nr:hypothetical protein TL16_g08842 [Triparma laevis f. inornata]